MGKLKRRKIAQKVKKPTSADTKLWPKKVAEALRNEKGLVTVAAKRLGVSYEKLCRFLKENIEMKAVLKECEELELDFATSTLHRMIRKEVPSAVIYYLKTKGRKRGFGPEDDKGDGSKERGPITFNYNMVATKKDVELVRKKIAKKKEAGG